MIVFYIVFYIKCITKKTYDKESYILGLNLKLPVELILTLYC